MTLDILRILEELRRSSLLASAQVEKLTADDTVSSGDPEGFRSALRSLGVLTEFQIDAIVADRIDSLIVGQSLVTEPLGTHADMPTFRAIDRTSRYPGILRRLPAESFRPEVLEVWRASAKIASQQRHPHLVSVLECAKPSDPAWVVHEAVDGVDIERLVAEMGAIPPHMVGAFVRPVIEAVAMFHADGLCHGLISPAVLTLTPVQVIEADGGDPANRTYRPVPGSIVRLDGLGLSVELPALMDANIGDAEKLGDLAFAAPERLAVGGYTPAMDIYSLGACLYFMLTTKAPIEGHTLVDVLLELQHHAAPRPIELIRSDIPSSLTDTIRQMLSADPADRPTAAQLLIRLRQPAPIPPAPVAIPTDLPSHVSQPMPPMAMETMTGLPRVVAPAIAMADMTYSGIDEREIDATAFVAVPRVEPLDSAILASEPVPVTESLSAWEMQGVESSAVEPPSEFVSGPERTRRAYAGPDVYADAPDSEVPSVRPPRAREKMGRYWLMALAGLILNAVALGLALQFLILPGCRPPTTKVKEPTATTKAKDPTAKDRRNK